MLSHSKGLCKIEDLRKKGTGEEAGPSSPGHWKSEVRGGRRRRKKEKETRWIWTGMPPGLLALETWPRRERITTNYISPGSTWEQMTNCIRKITQEE
jgi:hypothetical protein